MQHWTSHTCVHTLAASVCVCVVGVAQCDRQQGHVKMQDCGFYSRWVLGFTRNLQGDGEESHLTVNSRSLCLGGAP